MRVVRMTIAGENFLETMRDLQRWLDEVGFSVTRFNYGLEEPDQTVEIDIEFPLDEEAEIFCSQFEGEIIAQFSS